MVCHGLALPSSIHPCIESPNGVYPGLLCVSSYGGGTLSSPQPRWQVTPRASVADCVQLNYRSRTHSRSDGEVVQRTSKTAIQVFSARSTLGPLAD